MYKYKHTQPAMSRNILEDNNKPTEMYQKKKYFFHNSI